MLKRGLQDYLQIPESFEYVSQAIKFSEDSRGGNSLRSTNLEELFAANRGLVSCHCQ